MMDTNNEMDEDNLYNRKKKRRTKDRTKGRRNIKEKKGRKMRTKKWRMCQRSQLKLQFSQFYHGTTTRRASHCIYNTFGSPSGNISNCTIDA